jgi:hypothetical protein
MIQEFYIKEIRSIDFPQHGEVFYFYGQALYNMHNIVVKHFSFNIATVQSRVGR